MAAYGNACGLAAPEPRPSSWERGRAAIARALRLDLTHAQEHYARALAAALPAGGRWLDLGCGRQIVPQFAMGLDAQRALVARASLMIGLDVDSAIGQHPLLHGRVMGLGETLPFAARSFDLVTANVVVEHVADPKRFLGEIRRVLRPGGRFLFHTPNYTYYLTLIASVVPDAIKQRIVWMLERRNAADVFPTHYRMNTMKQVRALATACGFEVESLRVAGSVGSFGMMGPLGWLECIPLKLAASVAGGRWNSSLIASLRRPAG
jgi:SAM-dependent methyltransferase